MGYNVSWIAASPCDIATMERRLRLRSSGQTMMIPFEAPISASMLPSSWCLVALKKPMHPLGSEEVLTELSRDFSVVRCQVEEHCMFSSAEFWQAGDCVWRVEHDYQRHLYDVDVWGSIPDAFKEIRAEQVKRQRAERRGGLPVDHIFEVPLLLARDITGFKHDEWARIAGPAPTYVELIQADR